MSEGAEGSQLAQTIRAMVRDSGLSQHQIAREAGLKQSTLSKFMSGGSMKIETLGLLLEYLDADIQSMDAPRIKSGGNVNLKAVALPRLEGLTGTFSTILVDPPWRFQNRTGKMAPEHRRLRRYETMSLQEIKSLPVWAHAASPSHLYLWCPNALLPEGLAVMDSWGFTYKTNVVWYKIRKDGGPDGRGVGFYFRNVTELLLFGIKGSMRTLAPGRSQVNMVATRKREHSRKPVETYDLIESCSPGPYLELFARERVDGWTAWGNEVDTYEENRPLHKAYNGKRTSTDDLRRQSMASQETAC